MRALLDQIEAKIRAARIRYDAARQAMLSLRGPGPWEATFQVLKSEDVRGINERCVVAEDNEANRHAEAMSNGTEVIQIISTLRLQTGEGHRAASWIWYTATVDETNDGTLHDGIRLEWLKSRARNQRWREELLLLEEEMRRVLQYTEWRASWWEERASRHSADSSSLAEGFAAYALEQAAMEHLRKDVWGQRWEPVRARAKEVVKEKLVGSGNLWGMFENIEIEIEEEDEVDDVETWSDYE